MSGIIFDTLASYATLDEIEAELQLSALLMGDGYGTGLIGTVALRAELEDDMTSQSVLEARLLLQSILAEPAGDYLLGSIDALGGRLIQSDPTPEYTLLIGVLNGLWSQFSGTVRYDNALNVGLPEGGANLFEPDGDYLVAPLTTMRAVLSEPPGEIENYIIISQSPGYVWAYGAWTYAVLADGVLTDDAAEGQYRAQVVEAAMLVVDEAVRLSIQRGVTERVVVDDLLATVTRAAVAEGVLTADSPDAFARALLRVVDAVALANPLASSATITAAVAAGVVAAEAVRELLPGLVTEAVSLVETLTDRMRALGAVIETLLIEDAAESQVKVIALVDDSVTFDDDAAMRLWALGRVREGVAMAMRLRFGGNIYTGWVVNTATKAVSTYTNYPFNSFAVVGHTAFGAADDGLHVLTGDTDNGEQINAAIRTVLSNLGTGRKKRVPDVYLGYTSTGMLVMKVITAEKSDGERTEDWYKLTEQPAGTMREGRIKPGKGLSSVYWAFELVNAGGADFEIDKLDLYPIILERRV